MNNRIKCDTTMLQSNTGSHLMAFMMTQRDLLLELLDIVKLFKEIHKASRLLDHEVNFKDVVDKLNDVELKRRIKEVSEDFEYILKLHAHALHQRTGNKLYKKDKCINCDEKIDTWATN